MNADHKAAQHTTPLDQIDFESRLEELEHLPLADKIKINLLFWAPIIVACTSAFWFGWTLGDANGALRSKIRHEIQCQELQPQKASNCPAGSIDTGTSCQIQTKNLVL